nr:ChaN family lipoprotein [Desulfosarcinaceae bacterium]
MGHIRRHNPPLTAAFAIAILATLFIGGCAVPQKTLQMPAEELRFSQGAIIATAATDEIDFDTLIDRLSDASVVYVGERHTSNEHHEIQLRILTALVARGARVKVGMEMFDHTYQPILDRWSAGELETQRFLELTHWYANWRFDYDLYRPILDFVQENRLDLIGLNLPFHLPPKISTGGIESLRPDERALIA